MIRMMVLVSLLVVEEQIAQPTSLNVTMEIADTQSVNYHAYQQVGNAMETWIVWTVVMRAIALEFHVYEIRIVEQVMYASVGTAKKTWVFSYPSGMAYALILNMIMCEI